MNSKDGQPSAPRYVQKHMSGRYGDIWLSFSIVTLPLIAFTGLLLGLVSYFQVTHASVASINLRLPTMVDEPGVYYVNLRATLLIFIASWSSSLGPLLAGFVMNLASYPLSRRFWSDVTHEEHRLPTPFQFALILKFISSAGWGALYSWTKYLTVWRKRRHPQSKLLRASASVTILATFLGVLIFLADTWLHIATSTVNFVQVGQVAGGAQYSFALNPECLTSNNSFAAADSACNLNPAATQIFLMNSSQALRTLNNVSDTVAVLNNGPDSTYTYLGIPPSAELASRDYTATTFGMRTECKPISTECNLDAYAGASTRFSCSAAFAGELQGASNGWIYTYFSDESMQSNTTYDGISNPYYYGLAALFKNPGLSPLQQTNLTEIPEIVTPVHGGVSFVLLCSITVYDIEYDSVNGSITRFATVASNSSVANIWQGPMAFVDVAQPNLQTAASVAASISSDAQDLADRIALSYSRAALGVGAQSVHVAPAVAVQERSSFLVTRLPAVPFFSLVAANLAFVVVGIVLTALALAVSGGEVRDIQARLSIEGLVANQFEGERAAMPARELVELFEEHDGALSSQVMMQRSALGGYLFRKRLPVSGWET